MTCKKCSGRILVDRTFSDNQKFDLYCLTCGRRVFVSKFDNPFGVWLEKREKFFYHSLII